MSYYTIVLDCLQTKAKSEIIQNQMNTMFDAKDYLYLRKNNDDFGFYTDEKSIANAADLRGYTAQKMPAGTNKFNAVFFMDVQQTNQSFRNDMFAFCQLMRVLFENGQATIDFYFHVCKDDQDGKIEYLKSFSELLVENTDHRFGSVFLIDYLWNTAQSIQPWISATVRMMHILAQDEDEWSIIPYASAPDARRTLQTELRSSLGAPTVFANCRMTRLDDEDVQEKLNRVRLIEMELEDKTPVFPIDQLKQNYQSILEDEKELYLNRFKLSASEFPIAKKTFGCFLMKRKYQANLEALNDTLRETIRVHVNESVLGSTPSQEKNIADRLKTGIPDSCLGLIEENLRLLMDESKEDVAKFSFKGDDLQYCRKVEKLRDQIKKQINKAKESDSLNAAIEETVNKRLLMIAQKFTRRELTPQERKEKEEELRTLTPVLDRNGYFKGVTSVGGIQDGQNAIKARIGRDKTYMLVSSRIANEWKGIIPSIIAGATARPVQVFDYHDLQEDEFQTLTVRTWDQGTYDSYKYDIFKLESNFSNTET